MLLCVQGPDSIKCVKLKRYRVAVQENHRTLDGVNQEISEKGESTAERKSGPGLLRFSGREPWRIWPRYAAKITPHSRAHSTGLLGEGR